MSNTSLINNAARLAADRSRLFRFAEILAAPFERPLRAVIFLALVAAWPEAISLLVTLSHWHKAAFHG